MNYQRIYDQIVDRAKSENRTKSKDVYYEAHHIIPKCMGGLGSRYDYDHPNMVLLTGREHFLCHWLLHEIHPNNKGLTTAFIMMCNIKGNTQRQYTPSSRLVEYSRILNSNQSKNGKNNPTLTCPHCNKTGKGASMHRFHFNNCKVYTGVTIRLTPEHLEKTRLSSLGRKQSEETRKKRSDSMIGRKKSEEHVKNSVLAKKKNRLMRLTESSSNLEKGL
jgi:hypothetical protein